MIAANPVHPRAGRVAGGRALDARPRGGDRHRAVDRAQAEEEARPDAEAEGVGKVEPEK